MKIVIESPLRGKTKDETRENLRYLLWCCRAAYLAGYRPIASHLVCPFFMNNHDEKERSDGIDWPWMWEPGVPHWFFVDRGHSPGMDAGRAKCREERIPIEMKSLISVSQECWKGWADGKWPPHTEGFGFDE